MDTQEYKIWQTAKSQGKDDAFIKGAIQAYRGSKVAPKIEQPAVQSDHGFLGNVAADIVKPFARMGTNLTQSAQIITGNKPTTPFSGSLLGDVQPVGVKNGGGLSWENLKDSIGTGAELASNLPLGKTAGIGYSVLKNAAKEGGIQALKSATVPLIKEGATTGFLNSLGKGLQTDKSGGEIALDTALGTATGAVAAPLFGVGTSVIGNQLGKHTNIGKLFAGGETKLSSDAVQKNLEKTAQYVRSPLDKLEKSAMRSGKRETEYTFGGLGKKQNVLGDEERQMAQALTDKNGKSLIEPKMSKTNQNIAKVQQNVNETYNNDLIPFLQENPHPYDWADMKNYMDNKMKPSGLLKGSKDNLGVFNQIKNDGIQILNQFPKTQEGIQRARSAIDDMINTEFGPAVWDNTHPMHATAKEAALKLRTTLNDFTHDSIRVGGDIANFNKVESFINEAKNRGMKFDDVQSVKDEIMKQFGSDVLPENELKAILFRNKLKDMNLKLKAIENMWDNSQKEVGKTRLENIKMPGIKKAIGIGGGLAGASILGGYYAGSRGGNTN